MKKENLGLELIQTRLEGVKQIWVDIECEDGYSTEVFVKVKINLDNDYQIENQLKKARKYIGLGRAMVTLYGIGDSVYDKKEFYRITNRWYEEVEVRPLQDNHYEIHHVEKVDTPLKATNTIMKSIKILIDHVKELQKEN